MVTGDERQQVLRGGLQGRGEGVEQVFPEPDHVVVDVCAVAAAEEVVAVGLQVVPAVGQAEPGQGEPIAALRLDVLHRGQPEPELDHGLTLPDEVV